MAQLKRPNRLVKPPPALTIPDSPRTSTPTLEGHSAELNVQTQKDLIIISVIGRGNSGLVEKCLHVPSSTLVACKRVPLSSHEDQQMQAIKEVALLSRCSCRNIVKSYAAFVQEANIFIVMELMDKGSLKDALKICGRLPEAVISQIAYQVINGLDYLHRSMRIVHRDIKPSNLLLSSSGLIKISDFGVSCENTSRTNSYIGTASYMSVRCSQPERLETLPYSADTDIWSLGVTLLECALGYYPYTAPEGYSHNLWSLIDKICKQPSPIPSEISLEFQSFLRICLGRSSGSRSTSQELLKHPFILEYTHRSELFEWINKLPNKCN